VVYKDNLTFGLRKATSNQVEVPEDEKEYGLFGYKPVGDTELWVHFENKTKMLVENVKIDMNERKLIRIDPPKPTPEEIAAREEKIKAAQIAASKSKGKNAQNIHVPTMDDFKDPEPTWEPESLSFLDQIFT